MNFNIPLSLSKIIHRILNNINLFYKSSSCGWQHGLLCILSWSTIPQAVLLTWQVNFQQPPQAHIRNTILRRAEERVAGVWSHTCQPCSSPASEERSECHKQTTTQVGVRRWVKPVVYKLTHRHIAYLSSDLTCKSTSANPANSSPSDFTMEFTIKMRYLVRP